MRPAAAAARRKPKAKGVRPPRYSTPDDIAGYEECSRRSTPNCLASNIRKEFGDVTGSKSAGGAIWTVPGRFAEIPRRRTVHQHPPGAEAADRQGFLPPKRARFAVGAPRETRPLDRLSCAPCLHVKSRVSDEVKAMVEKDPDRLGLAELAPLILKPLRKMRGVPPPEMALRMGMSTRAYRDFENGRTGPAPRAHPTVRGDPETGSNSRSWQRSICTSRGSPTSSPRTSSC